MKKKFEITHSYSDKMKRELRLGSILMMANIIFWSLATLLMFSCEPAADPTRQFITYKGDHYSWPKLTESLQNKALAFEAKFNPTAIYDFQDESIQSDKNKLMGFCDCNSTVHENSARFAWQWFNNRLEIYAYTYVNGERQEQFIGVVEINEYNHYELALEDSHYVFKLNNNEPVYMERAKVCLTGVYLKLWPYFGGHIAAPHDVVIDIKAIY